MFCSIDEKVKEYILSNLKVDLTDSQFDTIIEQIYHAGYNLEISNNNLKLDYIDQNGIHGSLINVENLIDMACKLSYEKRMNIKSRVELGVDDLTEYCNILKKLCELTFQQYILDAIYKKTQRGQVLMAAIYKNKIDSRKQE